MGHFLHLHDIFNRCASGQGPINYIVVMIQITIRIQDLDCDQ